MKLWKAKSSVFTSLIGAGIFSILFSVLSPIYIASQNSELETKALSSKAKTGKKNKLVSCRSMNTLNAMDSDLYARLESAIEPSLKCISGRIKYEIVMSHQQQAVWRSIGKNSFYLWRSPNKNLSFKQANLECKNLSKATADNDIKWQLIDQKSFEYLIRNSSFSVLGISKKSAKHHFILKDIIQVVDTEMGAHAYTSSSGQFIAKGLQIDLRKKKGKHYQVTQIGDLNYAHGDAVCVGGM